MALIDIATKSGIAEPDILANALVLCGADAILPVERGRAKVARFNQAIRDRLGGANEIAHLALPCGTALKINDAVRGLLSGDQQTDWRKPWVIHCTVWGDGADAVLRYLAR
jgi:hypothetical protein